jgi:phosphatidylethanolamine/phosphatidyl-N-methylethanolamine N-methyltransferase
MTGAAVSDRAGLAPGERALFFRHWLRSPLGIGALLPSNRAVSRAMARAAQLERPGTVLELGGGTGSVTAALLEAGCQAERLVVVERAPDLAAMLRRRFPSVTAVSGDACALDEMLRDSGVTQLATVVSSLPIKWFSVEDQRAVIEPCFARLGVGGHFIQLTNALASPLAVRALGLDGVEIARVWRQIPPVQIWRYTRPARRTMNGQANTGAG